MGRRNLGVAQLVARYLGVVEAASSSLVTQTMGLLKSRNRTNQIVSDGSFFFVCFAAFKVPLPFGAFLVHSYCKIVARSLQEK